MGLAEDSEPEPPPSVQEELERFRKAWKEEIRQRTSTTGTQLGQSAPGPVGEFEPSTASSGPPKPTKRTSALDSYSRAVEREREGKLDDALSLYRAAFRLDSNVHLAYEHLLSKDLSRLQVNPTPGERGDLKPATESQLWSSNVRNDSKLVSTQRLDELLSDFPRELVFEPEDENLGAPLQCLPSEIILRILLLLDPPTVEKFATVCRKARVLSLDPSYWRDLVLSTYVPPQVLDEESLDLVVGSYQADYRRVFIEHPRLRLDGVYIAVCHYIRNGLSENRWVTVNHHITYHRYLRFLANGKVISLLTTEEHPPQTVIPLLKPTLAMKGCHTGDWKLVGTEVLIENLLEPDRGTTPKYSFQMRLELRSRPIGRWNRLELMNYDSVQRDGGEICRLPLKNERPFWFSRVRHYAA